MAGLTYVLCTLTAWVCAALLLRGYFRTKFRLLLWSGLCFVGLGLSHLLLVFDHLVFTKADLLNARLVLTLIATVLLLYGLIWEAPEGKQ